MIEKLSEFGGSIDPLSEFALIMVLILFVPRLFNGRLIEIRRPVGMPIVFEHAGNLFDRGSALRQFRNFVFTKKRYR